MKITFYCHALCRTQSSTLCIFLECGAQVSILRACSEKKQHLPEFEVWINLESKVFDLCDSIHFHPAKVPTHQNLRFPEKRRRFVVYDGSKVNVWE